MHTSFYHIGNHGIISLLEGGDIMEYKGRDYYGLGWFGQCVTHLIDAGYEETTDTILDKMRDRTLVTYIMEKYDSRFTADHYNLDALNEFFEKWAHYAESRKSGIFKEKNGLLLIPNLILSETESQIYNWTES